MYCLVLTVALAVAAVPAAQEPPGGAAPTAEQSAAPAERPRPRIATESRLLDAGNVRVTIAAADEAAASTAAAAVFAEAERALALLSERRPDSETGRLDRAAGGAPLRIGAELFALLVRGKELSRLTGGAFALTAGALTALWPFDAAPSLRRPPTPARLQQALASVGDDRIVLDAGAETAQLPAGTRVELRGLLRGYLLARALAVLGEAGHRNALVVVGGAVAASGTKGGMPWMVGIQDPRAAGSFAVLPVKDEAVATRGDYERFFEVGGRRFHDVLDPRTGEPASRCRSVTIVTADPVLADALSTAVMVLGPDAGMALVERMPQVGTILVTAGNQVMVSPSLESRVRVLRAPGP